MSRISITFPSFEKEKIFGEHVFIMRTDLMLQRQKYDQMMMMMPEMCTMQKKMKSQCVHNMHMSLCVSMKWMNYNLGNLELCADIVSSHPFFSM